ncbi:hypothetical protein BGY98DRAFT_962406 [Russula aff. rugulosa BPL654]|nr:hypothetical protein BGY98DRAFT_962406 [Russula aff. rugulosa BPL654]
MCLRKTLRHQRSIRLYLATVTVWASFLHILPVSYFDLGDLCPPSRPLGRFHLLFIPCQPLTLALTLILTPSRTLSCCISRLGRTLFLRRRYLQYPRRLKGFSSMSYAFPALRAKNPVPKVGANIAHCKHVQHR